MTERGSGTGELVQAMVERLARGERVRQRLPGGGRIHLDRALPFLAVYRIPPGGGDAETQGLVTAEPAYLIAPGEPDRQREVTALVCDLAEAMRAEFGAFLVVEIWSAREGTSATQGEEPVSGERPATVRRPTFSVVAGTLPASDPTVQSLERTLADIPLRPPPLDVEIVESDAAHPPELPPLLPAEDIPRGGIHLLGVEVQPVYRQAKTGVAFPVLLRTARRGLAHALRQTFHHFAINHTSLRAEHYHELGRRTPLEAVWEADRRLSEITSTFDFLLQVTPVNARRVWSEFERGGFAETPVFDYRPLVVDAAALKRRLYAIRTDRIEDPTLAHLLDDTRDELDRRITMLGDRNTDCFLYGSLQVYGGVDDALHRLALELLETIDPIDEQDDGTPTLGAEEFAAQAERELEFFRGLDPTLDSVVEVSGDVHGVMVSAGRLLVSTGTKISAARADALIQHEVGTHVLTHHNGAAQPLSQLSSGLARYEELQEGIAVFMEYLAGGLVPSRLRTLAARVAAVRCLTDGAEFPEAFREMTRRYGVRERAAFTLCMRVYRSGGLTKDLVYLRGLVRLLDYLRAGGELEPLFLGKIALAHLPLMQELRWRQVLRPPPLLPRCLTTDAGATRLARARAGLHPLQLLEEEG
ncbi:MAG: flavohemoglobin expression-modulating QEGLA motif protein [Longimicrobiaceae bacterium]